MGEVIAFRRREKPSRHSHAAPAGDAQILFFLGVRYMRMDDPLDGFAPQTPASGKPGGRKRKSRARL